MNNGKHKRKSKKKEDLPSLLIDLTAPPEDIDLALKPKASLKYLGPIFFGKCRGYPHHAPPHSLKLGSFHHPQHGMLPGNDNLAKLLLPQVKAEKEVKVMKPFRPKIKRQKVFHDLYPHKSPGGQKMFVPEVSPHLIDLGKTQSIIEGEALVEMPLCRVSPRGYKRKKSGSRPEVEFTTFSDVREKNRKYMSYTERIAHAHFPKEFTTVRVVGPTIPASITIKKLPTKRKTRSELGLELKAKAEEAEKEIEEKKDEIQEIESPPADSEYQEESELFGDEENVEEESERSSSLIESEGRQMDEEGEEREERETEESYEEEGEEEEGQTEEEQQEEIQQEEGEREERQSEQGQKEEEQSEGQKQEGPSEEGQSEERQSEQTQREEKQSEEDQKEERQSEQGQEEEGQIDSQSEGQKEEENTEQEEEEEGGVDAAPEDKENEEMEMFESEEENA